MKKYTPTNKYRLIIRLAIIQIFVVLCTAFALPAWEGTSIIAPIGVLPERGFYVGTGSYPKNTVVDITNLGNGRTIQVIVANNNNTPGGTVMLSRDAADALGMSPTSNGRIRISPPDEAVAFSRFADGRGISGDPDYDPRAFVRANALPPESLATQNPSYPSYNNNGYNNNNSFYPPYGVIPDNNTTHSQRSENLSPEPPTIVSAPLVPTQPIFLTMPAPVPVEAIPETYTSQSNSQGLPQPQLPKETSVSKQEEIGIAEVVQILPNPYQRDGGSPFINPNIIAYDTPEPVVLKPEISNFQQEEINIAEVVPNPFQPTEPGKNIAPLLPKDPELVLVEPVDNAPDTVAPFHFLSEPGPALSKIAANEPEITVYEPDNPKISDIINNIADIHPEETHLKNQPSEDKIVLSEANIDDRLDSGEASLPYYEINTDSPAYDLVDGQWVIKGNEDANNLPVNELPPEENYPGVMPADGNIGSLADALNGFDNAESSLPYAEPGTAGTLELVDGQWVTRSESDNRYIVPSTQGDGTMIDAEIPPEENYPGVMPTDGNIGSLADALNGFDNAESSLPYAEPGTTGTLELVDGQWVIKGEGDDRYIVPSEIPPEENYPAGMPSEDSVGSLADALTGFDNAESSLPYAEPGTTGTLELVDGQWVIKGEGDDRYIVPSEIPPEENYPGVMPTDGNIGSLADAITGFDNADTSLPYAEPGTTGTLELVDGQWVIKGEGDDRYIVPSEIPPEENYPGVMPTDGNIGSLADALNGFDNAESSLPYAEPGTTGILEIADGQWVIRDEEGTPHIFGTDLPPEENYPGIIPSEDSVGSLADALNRFDNADTSLPYAEPGTTGTLELVDGQWVIKGEGDDRYLVPSEMPPEENYPAGMPSEDSVGSLADALNGFDNADTSLPYAEPGTTGILEIVDGQWVIRDKEGTPHIFGTDLPPEENYPAVMPSEDSVGSLADAITGFDNADTSLPYAEPGMFGTVELVDGKWVIKGEGDDRYLVPSEMPPEENYPAGMPSEDSVGSLADALNGFDNADTSLPYAEPGTTGTLELVDGQWVIRGEGDDRYLVPSEMPPEENYPAGMPSEDSVGSLADAINRFDNADTSLPYAEPGTTGILEIVDGQWVIRDEEGTPHIFGTDLPPEENYPGGMPSEGSVGSLADTLNGFDNADTALPYAEPGTTGILEIVDGQWVIRDEEGTPHIFGTDLPPEENYPGGMPSEGSVGSLADTLNGFDNADTALPYAEPGMFGTVELVDGKWVIKGEGDDRYLVPSEMPPEENYPGIIPSEDSVGSLADALTGFDNADTSLPYAEPGTTGILEIVDGAWILRNMATDEVSFIGNVEEPQDSEIASLTDFFKNTEDNVESNFPPAEPGMFGTLELIDDRWVLRNESGIHDIADISNNVQAPDLAYRLGVIEPKFAIKETTTKWYPEFELEPNDSMPPAVIVPVGPVTAENPAKADNSANLTPPNPLPDKDGNNFLPPFPIPIPDRQDVALTTAPTPIPDSKNTTERLPPAPLPDRMKQKMAAPITKPETRSEIVMVEMADPIPVITQTKNEAKIETVIIKMADPISFNEAEIDKKLVVSKLEKGKYYLQLGLYDGKDKLTDEFTKLNKAFPYLVEASGGKDLTTYKLLVGPVNEGESNALLLRFKYNGYKGAFIREGSQG